MEYPEKTIENRIEGKVYIQFIVNKDGELIDERVIRADDELLGHEALRLFRLSPNWIPGRLTQNSEPCSVRLIVPITFKLPSEKKLKKKKRSSKFDEKK